ncbi:MAG: LapA family protein [Mycobacterium sp.]
MSSEPNVSPEQSSSAALPPVVAEPVTSNLPAAEGEEVKFTRAAALWTSLIFGFLILIVLLIFITQNTDSTSFTFLTWHWNLPLGVAILLAAVCGGLITALVSAARMFQLRRAAKKNLKVALKR